MEQQGAQEAQDWLNRYANDQHAWTTVTLNKGRQFLRRPLGLVETAFDADGTYFGGRADMTATLKLEIKHTLSKNDLRQRISLAWTLLRLQHVLLMSRVEDDNVKKHFVIDIPQTTEEAIQDVSSSITWLEDHGFNDAIDDEQLHHHALNVGRIIKPQKCLSKLHVLPLCPLRSGSTYELRLLIVIAHQISDGLSAYSWFRHFIALLNTPIPDIERDISTSISAQNIKQKLPLAQEDLYPKIKGNVARQRWFWAITRVLRHVAKTMPPTFSNPLRRQTRLEKPLPLPPAYASIFDYTETARPPLSSGHLSVSLSPTASSRLFTLCREANVSVGAGCFALAGLSMMSIYESNNPTTTPSESLPAFAASFPLNPRPFFNQKTEADSLMLAFSDGIVMPFLPSSLPIEARFRLVAKHANRELKVYQKRVKREEALWFDKHSSIRMLATGYLLFLERVDGRLPENRRTGVRPQGRLNPRVGKYGATCGVSSVGSTAAFFKPGVYDLSNLGNRDFAADYRGLRMGVRARDNEFLIGSSTDSEGIVGFGVSYDMNAISEEAAQNWAETIKGLLEKGSGSKL